MQPFHGSLYPKFLLILLYVCIPDLIPTRCGPSGPHLSLMPWCVKCCWKALTWLWVQRRRRAVWEIKCVRVKGARYGRVGEREERRRGSVSLFLGTCTSVEWEKKRRREIEYRGEKGGKGYQKKKWQLKCCYKKVLCDISDKENCFGKRNLERYTGKEGKSKYWAMVRTNLCPVKNFLTVYLCAEMIWKHWSEHYWAVLTALDVDWESVFNIFSFLTYCLLWMRTLPTILWLRWFVPRMLFHVVNYLLSLKAALFEVFSYLGSSPNLSSLSYQSV